MSKPAPEKLEYPCDFGVKVIGRDEDGFEVFVRETVNRFIPAEDLGQFHARPSSAGAYLSVSVEFLLRAREPYDQLCQALSADGRVKVVL